MKLVWTAWNEGRHAPNGSGYGIKIPISDRDKFFKREWKAVTLELPIGGVIKEIEVNVNKPSFWSPSCHELINKEIGHGSAPHGERLGLRVSRQNC